MRSFSSSKLIFLFFLVRIAIIAAQRICGTNGNFTNNSTYQRNLQSIFSSISSNTEIDYGFYNFSAGQNSDTANVVALCRGDIAPAACRSCVNDSSLQLTEDCLFNKEAIAWYGDCMIRYSNRSSIFRDTTNLLPALFLVNVVNATNMPQFTDTLRSLMMNLRSRAAAGDSRKKYAAGEVSLTSFQNIYGLVQCTPDLTTSECDRCLDEMISDFMVCCGGRVGGRFLRPRCNMRYETYRFFESNAIPRPASSIGTLPYLNNFKSNNFNLNIH